MKKKLKILALTFFCAILSNLIMLQPAAFSIADCLSYTSSKKSYPFAVEAYNIISDTRNKYAHELNQIDLRFRPGSRERIRALNEWKQRVYASGQCIKYHFGDYALLSFYVHVCTILHPSTYYGSLYFLKFLEILSMDIISYNCVNLKNTLDYEFKISVRLILDHPKHPYTKKLRMKIEF